jgi:hypothetical protein
MLLRHHGLDLPIWEGVDKLCISKVDLESAATQEGKTHLVRISGLVKPLGAKSLKQVLQLSKQHHQILADEYEIPVAPHNWLLIPWGIVREACLSSLDPMDAIDSFYNLPQELIPDNYMLGAEVEIITAKGDSMLSKMNSATLIDDYKQRFRQHNSPYLTDLNVTQIVYGQLARDTQPNVEPQSYIVDIEPRFRYHVTTRL